MTAVLEDLRSPEHAPTEEGSVALRNFSGIRTLFVALAAAGATFKDIVKQNTYAVNLNAEALPIIREVRAQFFPAEEPPASTLVGVTALAMEGLLIEVEVVAVVD